jgi:putative two-component system response regulator
LQCFGLNTPLPVVDTVGEPLLIAARYPFGLMTMTTPPVLIVESHPDDLAAMAQVLAAGHRLSFAWTGRDALASVRRQRPALILLNAELPDLDGATLCRALKGDPDTAAIPLVLLATGEHASRKAAAFLGADGCLSKPVSAGQLLDCVKSQLVPQAQKAVDADYRHALDLLCSAGSDRPDRAGKHPLRVGAYAAALAESAGWNAEEVNLINVAAALHDIGELGVPDAILLKPLKLDDGEWELMKTHCQIGHDMLAKRQSPVFQLAATIALHHHEKWDGSGYPAGLAGRDIPEAARIVAVADVFNALTTTRPYRKAWPVDIAMATLRGAAGSQLEPRLVRLFESILPTILEIRAGLEATRCVQPAAA